MEVGVRVRDGVGNRGTVRYVGPVATSKDPKAVWVGVVWDDPARGKHDGAVVREDGVEVRYFHCRGGASFVRPSKLDTGRTLVEAMRGRYVPMDAPLEAPGEVLGYALTKRGQTKKIELRGELRVRSVQQLDQGHVEHVSLRAAGVRALGEPEGSLGCVATLDLQSNLLGSWDVVLNVAAALPSLRRLDVSGNRLGDPTRPLPHVESLSANDCGISRWEGVETLASKLRVLHVASNSLRGAPTRGSETLRLLDVADTGLLDASPLGVFRNLAELHASENKSLKDLRGLSLLLDAVALASCGLDSWSAIDDLARLEPKRLRLGNDNPLSRDLGPSENRAFVIARLPTLLNLNGADVSLKERVEAEKRFLRVAIALPNRDLAITPRLGHLKSKYRDYLDHQASTTAAPKTLASNLVQIRLISCAGGSIASKKLPASTKVALLRRLAATIFDLNTPDMYFQIEPDAIPTLLDDDDKPLSYFGLPASPTIHVSSSSDDDNNNNNNNNV
ncbi:hypothetical protein CTAYLR_001349 [Chrysophaeum taylorii]|uniref:CAP-Gly domain-containing protein n=1 Tax=Chrysophaeum taylorii TaxID=2483200 RepID=A0AAD7U783_9STRA|nr:hypothetical protein CTAYLR_001349 [Chrysophaeum taylorii]